MKKNLLASILFLLVSFSVKSQVLYSEDFTSRALPVGWTNDSLGNSAVHLWDFTNPYARVITGAAFDTSFAIFDSDAGSFDDSIPELAQLTTNDINITGATSSIFLALDEQYRSVGGPLSDGSQRLIEYSADAGATWDTLVFDSLDYGWLTAVHTEYDITSLLGQSTVRFRFYWVGNWDWWYAIDNLQVITKPHCTTPPDAGNTVASMLFVCSFDSIHLSLAGVDTGYGLSYQWQSSPDGITWTDITGDSLLTAGVLQSAATYYQCGVTCSGITYYSVPVFVDMNPSNTCFCIPIFTVGCDAINKVAINTLINDTTQCGGNIDSYIHYPDTGTCTTSLNQNGTYDLIIASGLGSGNHGAGVWFDFNHDGNFQGVDEYFHISDSIPESSLDFITPITIPLTATLGPTRMRVRYIYNHPVTLLEDCSPAGYGETEDYTVTISPFVGIHENAISGVKVYPTPAVNVLNFTFGNMKGYSTVKLSDVLGNNLKSFTVNGVQSHQLSVENLASGVYIVKIENAIGTYTQKVILAK